MGCKGSKEGGDDDKKIDSSFKHTGLPKFDQLFENASTILETCEKIRGGLEDSKEDGMSWAGTDQLKDGKYIETLRVLLWAISSQTKGKILDSGIEPKAEKPYLAVNIAAFNYETRKLYETFQDYVNTVTDSPDDLQTAITKLQELVELIPDTVQTAKADLEASSMNFKQKADCAIAIKKNAEKLPKEVNKCKRLSEVLKEAAKDLKETVPELKTLVNGADEIGKKAEGETLYKPKEIFDKFHPGERAEEDKGKKDDKKGEKKEEKKGEKKEEKKDDKKDKSPEKKAEAKSPEKEEK